MPELRLDDSWINDNLDDLTDEQPKANKAWVDNPLPRRESEIEP